MTLNLWYLIKITPFDDSSYENIFTLSFCAFQPRFYNWIKEEGGGGWKKSRKGGI